MVRPLSIAKEAARVKGGIADPDGRHRSPAESGSWFWLWSSVQGSENSCQIEALGMFAYQI